MDIKTHWNQCHLEPNNQNPSNIHIRSHIPQYFTGTSALGMPRSTFPESEGFAPLPAELWTMKLRLWHWLGGHSSLLCSPPWSFIPFVIIWTPADQVLRLKWDEEIPCSNASLRLVCPVQGNSVPSGMCTIFKENGITTTQNGSPLLFPLWFHSILWLFSRCRDNSLWAEREANRVILLAGPWCPFERDRCMELR